MANKEPMTDEQIKNIVEEIKKQLPCIQSGCDLKGAFPGADGEPEPCQFCYEIRFPFFEKLTQSLQKYGEKVGIDIYTKAIELTRKQKQTVGEKNDYYITLEQLEIILTSLTKQEKGQR
jgi:hypothetical protein